MKSSPLCRREAIERLSAGMRSVRMQTLEADGATVTARILHALNDAGLCVVEDAVGIANAASEAQADVAVPHGFQRSLGVVRNGARTVPDSIGLPLMVEAGRGDGV